MAIEAGGILGHYHLIDRIGEGGMGVVWKAVDLTLGREVAVKVLPESLVADPERIARLEREAKALASLDHPGIVTIYSIEEADGVRFLTMELVRGRPLSALIADGKLSIEHLLDLASTIASALAAAHERGIVHRDLKPGNIMISEDGQPKVLDFGLAKVSASASDRGSEDETLAPLTRAGEILGTTPYMSPEQIQGLPTGSRSDIFALGIVIFEMASGRRPFAGRSAADVCSAILRDAPPPIGTVRAGLPDGLDRILRRCLEKDPSRRYQTALDVRNELDLLRTEVAADNSKYTAGAIPAPDSAAPATRWPRRRLIAATGLGLIALIAVSFGLFRLLGTSNSVEIRSIAVLPFANQMGDANQDYFVDGMHDALITELAMLGKLQVKSRQSVMRYRKSEKTAREIASDLGVDAVIEGSVLRVGSRVRITAKLIDARTDSTLWGKPYERDLSNALSILAELTNAVADQLKIGVSPGRRARLTSAHAANPEAQDLYLRGRQQLVTFTGPGISAAQKLFQDAIAIDPQYARAHSGLSVCRALPGLFGNISGDAAEAARASALKAIELDDQTGEAHVALGLVKLYFDWDWEGARVELRRGLELNASDWIAYRPLADYQLLAGDHDGAVQTSRTMLEIDPANVVSHTSLGSRLFMARRFKEALDQAHRMQEIFRGTASELSAFFLARTISFHSYWQLKRKEEAINELRADISQRLAGLGNQAPRTAADNEQLIAALDRGAKFGPDQALREFASARNDRARRDGKPADFDTGRYFAMVGDADRAMPALEHGFVIRSREMITIGIDPTYDPIRSDPRFASLVARMKFPPRPQKP